MKSRKLVVLPLLVSALLGWNAVGCGSRGTATDSLSAPCTPATAACLSWQIGQICDGQGRWATFQCAPNQVCAAGACVAASDSSTESCKLGEVKCLQKNVGQVCQGDHWEAFVCGAGQECRDGHCSSACTSNERKCVTSTVLQVCPIDGANPITVECPIGMKCQGGECIGSCTPNTRSCSASHVVRECRADGAGYVEQPCPNEEYCKDGRCTSDPSSECISGDSVCMDSSTALVCKKDNSGYEAKICAKGTSCERGMCRGPVCAAGAVDCLNADISTSVGLRTCNEDGNGYTVAFCKANEVCYKDYYAGQAKCYVAPCSDRDSTCGDPQKLASMPHRLNRCEPRSTGHLGWVSYACDAPAICKEIDGLARCVNPCVPGAIRCGVDGFAIDTCDENGNWVSEPCNPERGSLACVQVPLTGKIVCGDPECREFQDSATTYKVNGVCADKQIRRCGEDGRLGPPVDCDYGECVYPNTYSHALCQGAK